MGNAQDIDQEELARRVGPSLHLEKSTAHQPVFRGRMNWHRLRDGLSLHCSDCEELQTLVTTNETRPHLAFLIFLEGRSQVAYDSEQMLMGCPRPGVSAGVALSLAEPVAFRRQSRRGQRIRKVGVSLAPEWFESAGFADLDTARELAGFARRHLAVHSWRPSERLQALAEQMLRPPDYNPLLRNLYLETRALDLASEAMGQFGNGAHGRERGLRPQEHQRVRRTLELLHSDTVDGWTLDRIAREVGTNASTLQRHFHHSQGLTVFEYLRRYKLQRAREALERHGVSVSQAAWQAGYSSAANFSTAFKRAFGLSPRQARTRL